MLVQVGVDVLGGGAHGWRRWVAEVEVGDAELEWRCGIEWRVEGGVWRWWREWRMACGGYNGGSGSTRLSTSVSMLSPSVSASLLRPRCGLGALGFGLAALGFGLDLDKCGHGGRDRNVRFGTETEPPHHSSSNS